MHELSLAESMRELIEEQAAQDAFAKVSKVVLEIGSLSHVSAEAMQFCFASVMLGSIAESAALQIDILKARAKCKQCNQVVEPEQLYEACPYCGQFGLQILSGDQVRIKSLEVM